MVDGINTPENEPQNQNTNEQPKPDRAAYFVSDLDTKLASENVEIALAIILDPKSQKPILYAKGSTYNITRLAVHIARYFKEQLNKELEV